MIKDFKIGIEGIFGLVLIVILIGLLFDSNQHRKKDKKEYIEFVKTNQKILKKATNQIDSLQKMNAVLEKHYKDVSKLIVVINEDLEKSKKENEKLKKSRPIPYTDKQLDSLRAVWYPR